MSLGWMGGWSPRLAAAWRASSQNCSRVGQYPPWENERVARLDKEWILCAAQLSRSAGVPCTVVSVGIGLDWKFDVAAEAAGCNVFSFDPTIDLESAHERHAATFAREGRRIRFAPVGLGASTAYAGQYGSHGLRRVAQLDALLDEFVGPNRDIDVLKVDCEGCEWDVLQHLVEHAPRALCRITSIVQFELHFSRLGGLGLRNASLAPLLFEHLLLDHGFRPYATVGVNGAGGGGSKRGAPLEFVEGLTRLAPTMDTHACCYNVRFVRHARGRNCRATEHATAARRSAARHEHLGIGAGALPPLPTSRPLAWLLSTHTDCDDALGVASVRRMVEELSAPTFHVWINFYRDAAPCAPLAPVMAARPAHVRALHVRGFKPHFWKYVLTPNATAAYDLLLVTDADVRFEAELGWTPQTIERWLRRTAANAVTTLVAGASTGQRGGGHGAQPGGALSAYSGDSVACVAGLERTYVVRREAYAAFSALLRRFPDERLITDTGLEGLLCDAMAATWPAQPACVLLKHVAILHYDTHQIRKQGYDKYYTTRKFAEANNTLGFIERFRNDLIPPALLEAGMAPWRNLCWGVHSEAPRRIAHLLPRGRSPRGANNKTRSTTN